MDQDRQGKRKQDQDGSGSEDQDREGSRMTVPGTTAPPLPSCPCPCSGPASRGGWCRSEALAQAQPMLAYRPGSYPHTHPKTPSEEGASGPASVLELDLGEVLGGRLDLDLIPHRLEQLLDLLDLGLLRGGLGLGGARLVPLGELRLERADVALLDQPAGALAGLVLLGRDRPQELPRGAAVGVESLSQVGDGDGGHLNHSLCVVRESPCAVHRWVYHTMPRGAGLRSQPLPRV